MIYTVKLQVIFTLFLLLSLHISPISCSSPFHTKRRGILTPVKIALMTGVLGGFIACFGLGNPFAQHFDTVSDIPDAYFKSKTSITAVVEKITDGDTVRVRHVSGWGSRTYKGALKDNTIIVRLAAVDTPETAKRGNEGQQYAKEAKDFTERSVLGKEVKVKLLSKDQYNRVIGLVKYSDRSWTGLYNVEKDLSEELLKQGLAVVYRQGGARYDGSIEKWNILEKDAIAKKKGIWSNGADKADLPSTYKKKQRVQEAAMTGARNQL